MNAIAQVHAACENASAMNLMLALRTVSEAERALREHRSGFEERQRLERSWKASVQNARLALNDAQVDPDMLWRALL